MIRTLKLALATTAILALSVPARSQQLGEQFLLIGTLEKFTRDTPGVLLGSAVMRVSGHDVVIPRNLLIRFPTRFMTAEQARDFGLVDKVISKRPEEPAMTKTS